MGQSRPHRHIALVVEDDADLRQLSCAVLEETDLAVVEASSAEEALHYLNGHAKEVAFVFADVRLPCLMSGVDLAERVRRSWPWIRTVLTSGAPLGEERDRIPDDVRFMPKPWRVLDVLIEAERATLN